MVDNVVDISTYRTPVADPASAPVLRTGGGGGTFDGMEARVAQLEKQYEKIDGKLDRIADAVARVDGRLAKVEGRVETLPTAKDFGDIRADVAGVKSQVASLPTFAKLSALVGIVGALYALMPKLQFWASKLPF